MYEEIRYIALVWFHLSSSQHSDQWLNVIIVRCQPMFVMSLKFCQKLLMIMIEQVFNCDVISHGVQQTDHVRLNLLI